MMIRTATFAAASAALLLLSPAGILASPHGGRLYVSHQGSHFRGHFRGAYRYGYGLWPWYGGYAEVPPIGYGNGVSYAAPTVIYVAEPPRALSCHRTQQTVTVPDGAGGTSKITVTRC
jgi:hypothetical protein